MDFIMSDVSPALPYLERKDCFANPDVFSQPLSPVDSVTSTMKSGSFYSLDSSYSPLPLADTCIPSKRKLSELYPIEQPCTLSPPAKRVRIDDDPSLPRVQMTCMKLFLLAVLKLYHTAPASKRKPVQSKMSHATITHVLQRLDCLGMVSQNVNNALDQIERNVHVLASYMGDEAGKIPSSFKLAKFGCRKLLGAYNERLKYLDELS
ncbi:uncharacterized protein B0J16DRAFT_349433, partial [Fusarium flagelliforme]|uniref:uncharacterized protein n=1 Tax=Fusarium flagelliforme TaxID=2675880 RepID=UPI001E8E6804